MGKQDYIPAKDAELVAWSANFTTVITANSKAWEIPDDEINDLQAAADEFAALHAQADSPVKNAVVVAEKNAARKALIEKIRTMAGFRLKNPVITDVDLIAMGLHPRDTTRTPVPVPVTRPKISIELIDVRRFKVVFQNMDTKSKAKPYGVNGAVIAYAVLDAPPADPDALTRSVLATRTPHILEFTEEERGKTVYIAICWQNEKGQKGPWSEIESAIVP
jgi:hypothetical protein